MCYWQIVTSHYQTVISFVLKETVRGYWLTKKKQKTVFNGLKFDANFHTDVTFTKSENIYRQ